MVCGITGELHTYRSNKHSVFITLPFRIPVLNVMILGEKYGINASRGCDTVFYTDMI